MLTRRELLTGAAAAAVTAVARPVRAGQGVSFLMPAGAADCHAHIFCDTKAFPMSPARSYTPEAASLKEYLALAQKLGIDRTVFIQPTVYGTDNTCLLAAF